MKRLYYVATIAALAIFVGCGREIEVPVTPEPAPTVVPGSDNPVQNKAIAPDPTPMTTPTATPTPTPDPQITSTYIFQNVNICIDIKTWDSNTTIIKTYANASNTDSGGYFLLRWDGAFICDTASGCGQVSVDQDIIRSDIHGEVCRIHIVNGQYAGVTP